MPRTRLFLLLLLLPLAHLAGGQTLHQPGYWLRAYLRVKLTDRWTWHSELDERRLLRPGRQWQLITHQHLHYRLATPLAVGLGLSYSRQPPVSGGPALQEGRGFAEATLTTPLSQRVHLLSRLRLEQRWLEPAATELPAPWTTRARLRYRLQTDWQLADRWKLRASDELLLNPNSFDQNRLYAGTEHQLGAGFAAELGYLWLYQRRYHRPDYLDRHVLRLTLSKDLLLHRPPQS
ncbi:DUF2490 domain-containing protein [Hymenobacter rubripertinctus]|uniref:DUF2490 domain-containing protein n=1 Tax=Hymenobacter rubripertinctus TaxID=2029981 RepID=A0A418QVV2_9BACT|nr:DUF2490 domain-containing protein [Hymenobacter rubripertinctus]RIY09274.1 DUF2490 domain-containing protein [Hymenobacter rubripertinctus]